MANLIYEPEKVTGCLQEFGKDTNDWKKLTIFRLVQVCKEVGSKYTRSKVKKNAAGICIYFRRTFACQP